MAKPNITTRATKGSALTWTEGDQNLENLRDATISVSDGTNTAVLDLNDTLIVAAGTNVSLSIDSESKSLTINSTATGGLQSVSEDLAPQLGGDLDVNGNAIVSSSNGNIEIQPDGTGKLFLDGLQFKNNAGVLEVNNVVSTPVADIYKLLINFDSSTQVIDSMTNNVLSTSGSDWSLSQTQTKFGAYSWYNINPDANNYINLTSTNIVSGFTNQDWTIDMWVYPTSGGSGSGNQMLVNGSGFGQGPSNIYFSLDNNVPNNGTLRLGNGNNQYAGPQVPSGSWHHIGVMRKDGVVYWLYDGSATAVDGNPTINFGDGLQLLGGSTSNAYALGYVANIRVINTGLFTPGTYSLPVQGDYSPTGTIENFTSALPAGGGIQSLVEDTTPQLGGDLDVMNYNITTSTGNVKINGLAWPSTAGTNGYVLSTDGNNTLSWIAQGGGSSGGSIALTDGDSAGSFSNNRVQISMGYQDTTDYSHFIHTRHNSSNSGNAIDFYVSGGQSNGQLSDAVHSLSLVSGKAGFNGVTDPTEAIHVNGSIKLASGGTIIFPDNTSMSTAPSSGPGDNPNFDTLTVAYVTGGTDAYATDVLISNVQAYMVGDALADTSSNTWSITNNGVSLETTIKRYDGSLKFVRSQGDYLRLETNSSLQIGTNDFCVDFWFYPGSDVGSWQTLAGQWDSPGGGGWAIFRTSPTDLAFYAKAGLITSSIGGTITLNQWNHIAFVRSGSNIISFVNGVQAATTGFTTSSIVTGDWDVCLGANGQGSGDFLDGYIERFRFTVGAARYTSNFTPPEASVTVPALSVTDSTTEITNELVVNGLTYPSTDGTADQVLKTDGSGNLSWSTLPTPGITSLSQDLTPSLGGNLIVDDRSIVTTNNRDITLAPNGTGQVVIDGIKWPASDGTANQILKTDGSGNLTWTSQVDLTSNAIYVGAANSTTAVIYVDQNQTKSLQLVAKTTGVASTLLLGGATNTTLQAGGGYNLVLSGAGTSITLGSTAAISGDATVSGRLGIKDLTETVFNLSYSATITPNVANGTVQVVTLTGNVTFSAFTSPVAGQSLTLIVKQDGTGNRTLTSTMKFSGGSKTLSTTANAIDIITVFYDGTNYWASLGKDFK